MIRRYSNYIQPLGFAMLLLYFLLPNNGLTLLFFWIGTLLSILGTFMEIYLYSKLSRRKQQAKRVVVYSGIPVKLILISAIVLRVYDVNYSVYFLLAAVVIALVWNVFAFFYKPVKARDDEILDAPSE